MMSAKERARELLEEIEAENSRPKTMWDRSVTMTFTCTQTEAAIMTECQGLIAELLSELDAAEEGIAALELELKNCRQDERQKTLADLKAHLLGLMDAYDNDVAFAIELTEKGPPDE